MMKKKSHRVNKYLLLLLIIFLVLAGLFIFLISEIGRGGEFACPQIEYVGDSPYSLENQFVCKNLAYWYSQELIVDDEIPDSLVIEFLESPKDGGAIRYKSGSKEVIWQFLTEPMKNVPDGVFRMSLYYNKNIGDPDENSNSFKKLLLKEFYRSIKNMDLNISLSVNEEIDGIVQESLDKSEQLRCYEKSNSCFLN